MYISRKYYLKEVKNYIDKPLIKVITGQRRVGKTVFMRQLSGLFRKEEVLYINKEDKNFDFLVDDDDLNKYLEEEIKNGKKYIFCDEVQNIISWEKAINSIFSKYTEVDIFLSGSNSSLLSSELATLISGRYVQFQIFPFSFEEYLEYFSKKKTNESFHSYLQLGGLPLVYKLEENQKIIYDFVESLVDTIFVKDLIPRYKIRDVNLLKEIFLFLVNNMGNITNLSKILSYLESKRINTNFNTLASYVDVLKSAYLIYEVNLYDLQGKTIFDRERKFYIGDHIFIRTFFSGFDAGIGKILENIVFLEGLRKGYKVFVGKIKNNEIDFIFEKNGNKVYIQVCYILSDENVVKREFGNLELISDNWPKYVLSMDNIDFGIINGIKHIKMCDLNDIL